MDVPPPLLPRPRQGEKKKVASAADDAPAARVSEQQPAHPIRRVVDDRAPVARLAGGQRHYCRRRCCCELDPPAACLLPSCCYAVVIRALQLPVSSPAASAFAQESAHTDAFPSWQRALLASPPRAPAAPPRCRPSP